MPSLNTIKDCAEYLCEDSATIFAKYLATGCAGEYQDYYNSVYIDDEANDVVTNTASTSASGYLVSVLALILFVLSFTMGIFLSRMQTKQD